MTKTNGNAIGHARAPVVTWAQKNFWECERRVADLKTELETIETQMRVFRARNMALIGRQLCYLASEITARQKLDEEWSGLVHKRDSLLAQWTIALKYYSEAKSAT